MPVEMFGATAIGGARSALTRGATAVAGGAPGAGAFAESLGKLVDGVDKTAADANTAVTSMMNKTGDVHDAMIALQRAEMQFQLTVTLRNKFVAAYQDIMRMPV